ncbi:hypothetical protein AnigIFM63604_003974 [Aspergillus niger]|uniref:nitrilase n=1 Tax=Aspergillus niger TaxID=5061 RepID=A0A9W6EF96_ASPNG|nr:hypothetical protein AnigIFM63604_003974 [Aspergillus niger]
MSYLKRDSPEMRTIQKCAAANNIAICLGFSEKLTMTRSTCHSHSLAKTENIKIHRRKIKPTHVDRTVYGEDSGGSLMNIVDEPEVGRVGALSC